MDMRWQVGLGGSVVLPVPSYKSWVGTCRETFGALGICHRRGISWPTKQFANLVCCPTAEARIRCGAAAQLHSKHGATRLLLDEDDDEDDDEDKDKDKARSRCRDPRQRGKTTKGEASTRTGKDFRVVGPATNGRVGWGFLANKV